MIDALIYISWLSTGLLAYFVSWYIPNIDKNFRKNFWMFNILFLAIRALALTLQKWGYVTFDGFATFTVFNSIAITLYFCYYIHCTYGKKALIKKAEEDVLGAKVNFLESLPMICFIKTYVNGEFVCIYINPAFNEKVQMPNRRPPYDCVGKNNSYWGKFKEEYDKQDLEAWNGNNVKVDAELQLGKKIVQERFYKYRVGDYLYGFGMF